MHIHMDVKLFMIINAYDYMYWMENMFDNCNMKLKVKFIYIGLWLIDIYVINRCWFSNVYDRSVLFDMWINIFKIFEFIYFKNIYQPGWGVTPATHTNTPSLE